MTTGREIERQARETLEASIEHLDARVRSRLTRARHAALDELQRRARRPAWFVVPAVGFAASAILAVVLWAPWSTVQDPANGTALTALATPDADLDFLLGEDVFAAVFEDPAG
ncbi:MAG TPA: hypothetical protein PKL49_00650 [Steroidobacteraceae bacterium]|nr:hypothetical protein [Steroidobacteraceae bacterium]HNS27444.1 hypothetical protein [Steroidobacteraceae bacterium]